MIDRPITHIGYVVDDIPRAVDWAVSTLGAGPFFRIEHLVFDEVTFEGAPAAYDHSSAFGQWGDIKIELTVVHSASPPRLQELLGGPARTTSWWFAKRICAGRFRGAGMSAARARLGHVGYLTDDLDAETAALEAAGMPLFHTGRSGPVSARWFDGRATLGHHVEVLQRSAPLLGFYERIRSSHAGWDGSDPLRPGGPPPTG